MKEWLIIFFLLFGTFFVLLAAIGILRMPDIYLRMSSTTKAATLGVGSILVAVAIYFDDTSITTRSLTAILFLFLSAPVATHVIGRAAYFIGIPIWVKSKIDEMKGKYNIETHQLTSEEQHEISEAKKDIPEDDEK